MEVFNFLPWRERMTMRHQTKNIIMIILGCLCGLCIVAFLSVAITFKINNQIIQNQYIQGKINILDKDLTEVAELESKKNRLIAQTTILQTIQIARSHSAVIFDELVNATPEGVRLTSIKRVDGTLSLLGMARSNRDVSTLMRNLDDSFLLTDSHLVEIEKKAAKTDKNYAFNISSSVHSE
ncbi:MAG: PilN domain-containing protein [Porticoccaceae bacterium]|nr:PilN domain-containing protein [Porticoccaceae bacterium]